MPKKAKPISAVRRVLSFSPPGALAFLDIVNFLSAQIVYLLHSGISSEDMRRRISSKVFASSGLRRCSRRSITVCS